MYYGWRPVAIGSPDVVVMAVSIVDFRINYC
jgi:hypothetical protein